MGNSVVWSEGVGVDDNGGLLLAPRRLAFDWVINGDNTRGAVAEFDVADNIYFLVPISSNSTGGTREGSEKDAGLDALIVGARFE